MGNDEYVQPVILVLADLSGYTRFMTEHGDKPLRHSQMIVGDLLETLLKQVDVPLELSSLEGDALFLYAIKSEHADVWERRRESLVDRMLNMLQRFEERIAEIGAYSVCRCEACAAAGHLELKIIIHSGKALFTHIGEHPTLSGIDVITTHRLAKNSVPLDRYVLMTDTALRDLGAPTGVELHEATEHLDTGDVRIHYFEPERRVDADEAAIRAKFSDNNIGVRILRDEIVREYTDVAEDPARGFHFNTGRRSAENMGYRTEWLNRVPAAAMESFAGTGNPFSLGGLQPGEYVVDIGSGAGVDAIIAADMVGSDGHVIGVEMTEAMLTKSRSAAEKVSLHHLEFREGFAESLPVPDGWADAVISNGVVNLSPLKERVFAEIHRVLRPGGRVQIADITVERPVPEEARGDIDLWTS